MFRVQSKPSRDFCNYSVVTTVGPEIVVKTSERSGEEEDMTLHKSSKG